MARVVAVHGIGNQYYGPESMKADWLPSLRDGILLSGGPKLDEAELECAFYGNLFRKPGMRAGDVPPLDASDVQDEWEQKLLMEWWRQAAAVDPAVTGPEEKEMRVWAPGWVQRALLQISKSKFFAAAAENLMIYDLKQVKAYLHDDRIRTEAKARLKMLISAETKVLIAHSLGSLIAYEALFELPQRLELLVTLGSPLGIPNLIFDKLRPPPINGRGAWPRAARWTNVADKHDIVALEKKLSVRFGPDVNDLPIDNGADAHHVRPYLTAAQTGAVIAHALFP
jgi:hypothetical protein